MSAAEVSTDPRSRVDVLYRTYRHDVYRSLLRDLGSPADADDCTQTVFLSAMRALDRGCRPHAARAWLLAIAKNVARKAWRDRRSAVELEPDAIAADDRPDESRRELFAVLETLPSGQRTALVLHELYGLEYTEISELTDQTVAGVETSVFRARKAVRTAMRNGGAVGHDDASRLLRRLVDGKLTRNEREAVAAHVRQCEECSSAEAGLRNGKRRRGVFWLLSAPSGAQRLLGLLQASPARGLGAVGLCAMGLAAMPSDRPAPDVSYPQTPVSVAVQDGRPQTATPPPKEPSRPQTTRIAPVATEVSASGPSPTTPPRRRAAPATGERVVRQNRASENDVSSGAVGSGQPATPVRPDGRRTLPPARLHKVPLPPVAPVDLHHAVDHVAAVVGRASEGDLVGTGAAVDAAVADVLDDAGLPAAPPVAQPIAEHVEDLAEPTVVGDAPALPTDALALPGSGGSP